MNYSYTEFLDFCFTRFPYWRESLVSNPLSPYIFAHTHIEISEKDFQTVQNFISAIYKLKKNQSYQDRILGHPPLTRQDSVLMSYDFHITKNGPKLIEINTNASHFLTSYMHSCYWAEKNNFKPIIQNSLEKLFDSFKKEMSYFQKDLEIKNIAILDEDPKQQKAYTEFLMYKDYFKKLGYQCEIYNIDELKFSSKNRTLFDWQNNEVHFVYNRYTDFYLEKEKSKHLKEAYLSRAACFSPTPEDYQLLSDKSRLIEFCNPNFLDDFLESKDLESIRNCLLEIFEVNSVTKDELWKDRKKYFFKPMNSHGSKGVYDGAKITHNTFDQIYVTKIYLAQEIAPPPKIELQVNGDTLEAKYDLRFYVYGDQIQHITSRVYIGQTTNFKTLGGGYAPVSLI